MIDGFLEYFITSTILVHVAVSTEISIIRLRKETGATQQPQHLLNMNTTQLDYTSDDMAGKLVSRYSES